MSLYIKRIYLGDEVLFRHIAKDVFDQTIDIGLLKTYLSQTGNLMVLAIQDDQVVGQCAGIVFNHADKVTELYIDELGVGSDFRRQGIGRRILNEMFDWARAVGCDTAWVGAEPDNVAARALYDSYNGQPVEPFLMYRFNLNPDTDSALNPPSQRIPRYPKPGSIYKTP